MGALIHSIAVLIALAVFAIESGDARNCTEVKPCVDGMILPAWKPVDNIGLGDKLGRSVIYFIALIYMFLGVSIISDRFMASIEVITSSEKEITVKKKSGEVFKVTVRVWNETVSNLTLMALGSSAPEIMLSVIEVCGNSFNAGDLGPNTIVGSAAFNLFMIIALCVYVIPTPSVRRQQHLRVFCVTATWSVFAYVWMYIILCVISYGVIEIWEGLVTFLFFPLTVLTAYIADQKLFPKTMFGKRIRATKLGVDDLEMKADGPDGYHLVGQEESLNPEVAALEETRREFMEIFRDLRKKHPNTDISSLQQMAEYEMLNRGPKSRAFYRVQATRKLVGGGNIIKKKLEKEHQKSLDALDKEDGLKGKYTAKVFFDPGHYTVLENVGTFEVTVTREGGPPNTTIMVDYRTEDGSANAGSDYIERSGTLTLYPDDTHARVALEIIDDDIFEEDEHFYIHLENLRIRTKDGLQLDPNKLGGMPIAELSPPFTATVMILDDDHAGVFVFDKAEDSTMESCGEYLLRVARHSGARGKVIIPFRTIDGTAVAGKDYEHTEGEVVFENDDTEQFINIAIFDDQQYEKKIEFSVELSDPIWAKKLSDPSKVQDRVLRKQRLKKEKDLLSSEMSEDGASTEGGDSRRPSRTLQALQKDLADKASDSGVEGEGKSEEPNEDEMIADLGRPRLGEISKIAVKITESGEFKNVVDKMIKTANVSLVLGTSSWREQFVEALTVSAGDDDDDGGDEDEEGKEVEVKDGEEEEQESNERLPSLMDYIMHFITVPWKLLFAFVPPTEYWGGWACFIVSILGIGLITAFIGDIASHFGCTIGLRDAVTAISFVALGTSVPDTFASKVAAMQDKYSDSSIGNVTGSNAVNVFLGIGIAWSMAAIYHRIMMTDGHGMFVVNPGSLGYSVVIFCTEALLCIAVIVAKRHPKLGGGELGGPKFVKIPVTILFVTLWLTYVLLSALEAYCIIAGF